MRLKPLTDWLTYLTLRVFICIVQALRIETCHTVARVLAVVAADVVRLRGRVVDDNLRSTFADKSAQERRRLTRQMWEHLFLMVCEIAHAPRKIHRSNWHEHVSIPARGEFVRYLLDPRPMLLVTGHLGNFEIGGFVTGLLGFPCFTIARTLDNPYLDRYVNTFRGAKGQYILSKHGSSGQVEAVLAAGQTLSLLGDQQAGPKGCWVDFLGRPASCHKAIALFTLSSGAPLLVAGTTRLEKPMQFEIALLGLVDPQIPHDAMGGVAPLTQWYNERLGDAIRRKPDQYWWVHRRWKGEPPKRFRRLVKAA